MPHTPVSERVQKHRDALRASGLRPVQIWVPDSRLPNFAEMCRQQALRAAQSDVKNEELVRFMDDVLDDLAALDGWS